MNKKTRAPNIAATILAIQLILSVLFSASCDRQQENGNQAANGGDGNDGGENAGNHENAQDSGETDEYLFPELDCGGSDFTFLGITTTWDFYSVIVHESETGEILDDSIYARNRAVEEKFGINLKETAFDIGQVEGKLKNAVLAGENIYDAAYCPSYNNAPIGGLVAQNMFLDLNEIPELRLDEPWWNQTVNTDCIIGSANKLFFTACDINIMNLQAPWCVYLNEDMIKNLGLDLPYSLVKNGKWTLDEFHKYVKAGAQLNGAASFDWEPSGAAVFGYTSYEGGTGALLVGSGEKFISKDEKGMPYLSIETPRFFDVCEKIAELTGTKGIYQNANNYDTGFHFEYIFKGGRTLMMVGELKASDVFRDMDSTFGIVPIPKYDGNQDKYYSSVARQMPVLVIPATNPEPGSTGVILDAMAYLSTKNITPIFFDVTMSQKRLRNEESIEMLKIVKDSVLYDVGTAYGWSSDLYVAIRDSLDKGKNTVVSLIEKGSGKVLSNIEKTMELFD
ncbi:MAG: hypothetical protein FWG34_00800 [Oscillospiraceae bacterium]|nr:hypothetical protein [Oscillospiraceae bacterium]